MNRTARVLLAVSAVLVVGVLAGCGRSSVRVGWVETLRPGQWEVSYTTFSGTKVEGFAVDAEKTLVLDYEAEVHKGSLVIEVHDPDGEVLWSATLPEDAGEMAEVRLHGDGRHSIVARGDETGGGFDLCWELK